MLPELYTVNKAATWNESYRSYLGRSYRRKVGNPKYGVKLAVRSQQRS